ncbi:MAG: DUF3299 domain-containing protein [Pseudomonadota bacterium]
MRLIGLAPVFALVALLAACGSPGAANAPETDYSVPPPMPENAETIDFEKAPAAPPAEQDDDAGSKTEDDEDRPRYWGIAPGEAVPIMWEELMPEGSFEELMRQQDEFFAMLEKRYGANQTTLSGATPFSEIEEGSELDYMPQLGSFDVVEELDGELIRIPGYVVPFDFNPSRRHSEFLFVPYMGACIHTPPPPPNQIIFVYAEPAIQVKDIWTPYWLEGTLTAQQTLNELGDAAYSLGLDALEPYPVIGSNP